MVMEVPMPGHSQNRRHTDHSAFKDRLRLNPLELNVTMVIGATSASLCASRITFVLSPQHSLLPLDLL